MNEMDKRTALTFANFVLGSEIMEPVLEAAGARRRCGGVALNPGTVPALELMPVCAVVIELVVEAA